MVSILLMKIAKHLNLVRIPFEKLYLFLWDSVSRRLIECWQEPTGTGTGDRVVSMSFHACLGGI